MIDPLPLLEDLPPLDGKRVLFRADFNVPLGVDDAGTRIVTDPFRIESSVPSLEWLVARGAAVTVVTHLGRPQGKPDPRFDLTPVRELLNARVPGVELAENLRFSPGEQANDPAFVQQLIAGHDYYVNDAFSVCHRAHASVVGPPHFLPSAAGRGLANEVEALGQLLDHPARPFLAIVGGAKVADKLGVLQALAGQVDVLIVGGAMAYTFLAAQGHSVGASLLDPSKIDACGALLGGSTEIILPIDIVALGPGGALQCAGEGATTDGGPVEIFGSDIPDGWMGVDVAERTQQRYREAILDAKTVLWNGPAGVFEDPRFAAGTRALAEAVAACPGFTVAGGGDTDAALHQFGLASQVDHLSTGGGASLEFLEFGDLPGLQALRAASNAPHRHR